MASNRKSTHGQWSSSLVFVLAATGSAVGLGNIWKFPYMTGESGGGAFVLVYLLCIALVGIPIMMAEITMGRRGRQSPITTLRTLVKEENRGGAWVVIGWMGVLTGFLILSFYSVVAGWALSYTAKAATGLFSTFTADSAGAAFGGMLASAGTLVAWHTAFMVLIFLIVGQGVHKGLERSLSFLMPLLFVLLVILVGYGLLYGNFAQAAAFLFKPNFSALTGSVVLAALGHAFFTLSLGMGAIMVYGAYLPQQSSIGGTTLWIAGADTVVALLAGLGIFSVVFAQGLDAGSGPGLMFITLPLAFGDMTGGAFIGFVFFFLVSVAALTSGISIIEPVVAYLVEKTSMGRIAVTAMTSLLIWLIGLGCALSFNLWGEFHPLGFIEALSGMTFFDLLDAATSKILLPLGGLLIAIFAGWMMRDSVVRGELAVSGGIYTVWLWAVRIVAPLAVVLVMLSGLGIVDIG